MSIELIGPARLRFSMVGNQANVGVSVQAPPPPGVGSSRTSCHGRVNLTSAATHAEEHIPAFLAVLDDQLGTAQEGDPPLIMYVSDDCHRKLTYII